MRLIDADALMTWFDNHYDDEEVTVGFINGLIKEQPTIEPEPHEIGYSECANPTLKMWIDNVLTDEEYIHIMDKLNAYWAERRTE